MLNSDWMNPVLIAFVGQAMVLAVALTVIGGDAERRLAAAVAVLAGMMMVFPLGATGRADPPLIAAFFPLALPLALGPLLYGYVHGLSKGQAMKGEFAHFVPAIAQGLYGFTILCLPSDIAFNWKEVGHDNWVKPIVEGLVIVSLTAYSMAGLGLLRRYRVWLRQNRSDADRFAAHWVARVLNVLLLFLAALVVFRIYTWFFAELDTGLFHGLLGIFASWLGIEGLRHSERIFPPMTSARGNPVDRVRRDWAGLGLQWQEEIEQRGWWREPELTLATLARRLGTNSNYLSCAINEGLGTNFNALINRMRAREVARRISEDPGTSDLLSLALEAGFSSKATFNRAFRAAFGMAPREFRRLKS